ncbi:MAG: ATP-binding protein [Chlorobi bacterium]|nr:ATP-binding protein [Chlorobiota bacterium]
MLARRLKVNIEQFLRPNKVVLILGSRRVGKTVLINQIKKDFHGKVLTLNAEDSLTKEFLGHKSIANYKTSLTGTELLIIDEAQTIPDIGQILKLIVDEINGIKIIATGSSAFDLLNKFGEPLTGRSFAFYLFPFSVSEYLEIESKFESLQKLEERIVFGSYPELMEYKTATEKQFYLQNLVNTYLLKDIFALDGLRGSSKIFDLLKLLAFQIGSEVSPHELGNHLGMSKNTVEKYLNLLQKVFVIFELKAFSNNLRKEISKSKKWYFIDNGIRNAIINDFTPIPNRKDIGELWENFIIAERLKQNHYNLSNKRMYFWRTYDQQEIDLVEESDGRLEAFEIKWGKTKSKEPKAWGKAYPEASFNVVSKQDFPNWLIE